MELIVYPCLIPPYRLQNLMRHALICLLLVVCSAKADLLFSDAHQRHGHIFESDLKDVEATISQDKALELATDWAASFYEDDFLAVTDIEFRIDPLRFWLVTFRKTAAEEEFYAVVLPDGTIVEPQDEEKI